MSDLDVHPVEQVLDPADERPCDGPELLAPRAVPLGGPRAMPVLRALPNRPRHLIGAWCFVDVYGPVELADRPGMVVPPHPHTGLQTVSWIVRGEVEHRDSIGSEATVRPGGVGLMTAGRGIAHSEYSPLGHGPVLHGAQLWIALPHDQWRREPAFEAPEVLPTVTFAVDGETTDAVATRPDLAVATRPDLAVVPAPAASAYPVTTSAEPGVRGVAGDGGGTLEVTVLIGRFAGASAPTTVHSPLVGAGLRTDGCIDAELRLDPTFEHGIVALAGGVRVDDLEIPVGGIAYLPIGTDSALFTADGATHALLIGGEPFDDRIVMFWNFIAPSHDEVVEARAEWEGERAAARSPAARPRFGLVVDDERAELPAPALPIVRLRPRGQLADDAGTSAR